MRGPQRHARLLQERRGDGADASPRRLARAPATSAIATPTASIFITGRIKELIIKGGENIAPREIDEALLEHPAVLEAAAVGIPDRHYGQEILACVVLQAGQRCTEDELRDFACSGSGRYKTPKVSASSTALPKGPSGKVQRMKLLDAAPPG